MSDYDDDERGSRGAPAAPLTHERRASRSSARHRARVAQRRSERAVTMSESKLKVIDDMEDRDARATRVIKEEILLCGLELPRFSANNVRPRLRHHGEWMVKHHAVSARYASLQKEGLITWTGDWVQNDDRQNGNGGKMQKVYRLTHSGRRAAERVRNG